MGNFLHYIASKCPSVWPSLNSNISLKCSFGTYPFLIKYILSRKKEVTWNCPQVSWIQEASNLKLLDAFNPYTKLIFIFHLEHSAQSNWSSW